MLKPHGDTILPDDKGYFNFRTSWARLVTEGAFRARLLTEGAFRRLNVRFRVLFHKYESNKETVKIRELACAVLYNLCIERSDLVQRKIDLTSDHASNKCLSPEEVNSALALRITNHKSFEVNKKSQALKVQSGLTAKMWKEKQHFL